MPDTPNTPESPKPTRSASLKFAGDDVTPLRPIPALEHSFPSSRKVTVGDLEVPFRAIEQTGGNPDVVVYDTTGDTWAWAGRRQAQFELVAP